VHSGPGPYRMHFMLQGSHSWTPRPISFPIPQRRGMTLLAHRKNRVSAYSTWTSAHDVLARATPYVIRKVS
jgi:hypothetical protein